MSYAYLVSVVVCTYNRSEILQTCLDSLKRQTITADIPFFEVIIVNNNSTDDTQEIARGFSCSHPSFRVVLEEEQGLSHARNRGWREAQGKYVAYIDDDAKAHSNWIEGILNFVEEYPSIQVFGGPYYRYCTVEIPPWFPDEYGTFSLGEQARILKENEWLSGTNMIFNKELLVRHGGFDENLGMKGEQMAYGEETALMQNLKNIKIPIYYVPYLCVDHVILPHKLSLFFLIKSNYMNGREVPKIFQRSSSFQRPVIEFVVSVCKSFVVFCFSNEKHFKARLYRSFSTPAYRLGSLIGSFLAIVKTGIRFLSKNGTR